MPSSLKKSKKTDPPLKTSPYQTTTVLFFMVLFLAMSLAMMIQLGVVNNPLTKPLDEPMPADLTTFASWQVEHAKLIASLTPHQQALLNRYGKRWHNEQVRQEFLMHYEKSKGQQNPDFKPAPTLGDALYQQQIYERRYPNNPTAILGFDINQAMSQPIHLKVLPTNQQNPASGYLWLHVTNLSTDTWHRLHGELSIQANTDFAGNDNSHQNLDDKQTHDDNQAKVDEVKLVLPAQQFVPPLAPASTGLIRGQIQYSPHSSDTFATQHQKNSPSTNFTHPMTDRITTLLKKPLVDEAAQTTMATLSVQCQPCTVYDGEGNAKIYAPPIMQHRRQ